MIIPNIWKNIKCSKPPTRYKNQKKSRGHFSWMTFTLEAGHFLWACAPWLPEMNGDWRDWDEANRFMVIFYVIYSMEI